MFATQSSCSEYFTFLLISLRDFPISVSEQLNQPLWGELRVNRLFRLFHVYSPLCANQEHLNKSFSPQHIAVDQNVTFKHARSEAGVK